MRSALCANRRKCWRLMAKNCCRAEPLNAFSWSLESIEALQLLSMGNNRTTELSNHRTLLRHPSYPRTLERVCLSCQTTEQLFLAALATFAVKDSGYPG